MPSLVKLPDSVLLPLDESQIVSDKKEDLLAYLTDLVRTLTQALEQIHQVINTSPEYVSSATQPVPADGKFLVWYDTGAAAFKLLYGDGGSGHLL